MSEILKGWPTTMSASKITFSYFRFTLNTSVLVAWLVTTINCDYQSSAALTGGLSDLLGYFNTTSLITLFKTRVTVLLLSLTVVCVLYTVYIIFKSVTLELKKQSKQKSNFVLSCTFAVLQDKSYDSYLWSYESITCITSQNAQIMIS